MSMLPANAIITTARHLLSCDLSGETVLLDARAGTYFGLNAVGSAIWNGIGSPCSIDAVERMVMRTFDVTADVCRRDVADFLQKLATAGLIEVRHGTAP